LPAGVLARLGFKNAIGHRVFNAGMCGELMKWITSHRHAASIVSADPYDFKKSEKRYTGKGSAIA
jgi:hypothetical protein